MQPKKSQDDDINQEKQHVGYSFSSDFQSQQTSQQGIDAQKKSSPTQSGLKK